MPELKRKSCCCGATESNPCACMKKGIMKCSAKEPMCQCYKDLKKEGKHPADMKKSFDMAWHIAKKVPFCGSCDKPMPDGEDYGCSHCGQSFCEDCMVNDDQHGLPGYRGDIDNDHPAYEIFNAFGGGPYCPECASEYARTYRMIEGEPMEVDY